MSAAAKTLPAKSGLTKPASEGDPARGLYSRRHLRVGWWSLFVFLLLGIALETLHGFKVGAYLNVSNETRRLMWTLAHAHGTLLGLVNIAFGVTLPMLPTWNLRHCGTASACLLGASVLLPLGFFLGGVDLHGGDPGIGIFLVPFGAILLFVGVFLTALAATKGIPPGK